EQRLISMWVKLSSRSIFEMTKNKPANRPNQRLIESYERLSPLMTRVIACKKVQTIPVPKIYMPLERVLPEYRLKTTSLSPAKTRLSTANRTPDCIYSVTGLKVSVVRDSI
ncbi:MAG: hypothetical protein Q8K68_06390, partial [Nitrospirota bacterium]|nr:hypothetical protein [Nitrospirota bacterium]